MYTDKLSHWVTYYIVNGSHSNVLYILGGRGKKHNNEEHVVLVLMAAVQLGSGLPLLNYVRYILSVGSVLMGLHHIHACSHAG